MSGQGGTVHVRGVHCLAEEATAMQQKSTAEELARRLESLRLDLQITKQQYRVRHEHLVTRDSPSGESHCSIV